MNKLYSNYLVDVTAVAQKGLSKSPFEKFIHDPDYQSFKSNINQLEIKLAICPIIISDLAEIINKYILSNCKAPEKFNPFYKNLISKKSITLIIDQINESLKFIESNRSYVNGLAEKELLKTKSSLSNFTINDGERIEIVANQLKELVNRIIGAKADQTDAQKRFTELNSLINNLIRFIDSKYLYLDASLEDELSRIKDALKQLGINDIQQMSIVYYGLKDLETKVIEKIRDKQEQKVLKEKRQALIIRCIVAIIILSGIICFFYFSHYFYIKMNGR